MFDYSKIIQNRVVIHCDTEDKAKKLLEWATNNDLKWTDGSSYQETNRYSHYERQTCYHLYSGSYGNIGFYLDNDYTVYEFDGVFKGEEEKSVLKNLYIRKYTVDKLNPILSSIFGLELEEITLSTKDFGTSADKFLSHTDEGNFFVGSMDTKIKLGKILNACTDLLDYQIEEVVNEWKKLYKVNDFDVKISDDIAHVYRINYVGNSCMSEKDDSWFEIYSDIGSQVAYIEDNGKLVARALLHDVTNVKTNMRVKVIDRIFFDNEIYKLALDKWAEDNGYKQIYQASEHYITSIVRTDYEFAPYIDSLYLAVEYSGAIRLTNAHEVGKIRDRLQETGGGSEEGYICNNMGEDYVYCEDTGNNIHRDNATWVESEDVWYESEYDLVYVEGYGFYHCENDDIAEDIVFNEWKLKDDMNETRDGEWTSSDQFYELTEGEWANYYAHIDDIYSLNNGGTCHIDDEPTLIVDLDEYTLEPDDYYTHEDGDVYSYEEIKDDEEETA